MAKMNGHMKTKLVLDLQSVQYNLTTVQKTPFSDNYVNQRFEYISKIGFY